MKKYYYNKLSKAEIKALTKRPSIDNEKVFKIVKPILEDIKLNGLSAAKKYAKQFDGFNEENLLVSEIEFDKAEKELSSEIKEAINTAYSNIKNFHQQQLPKSYEIETMKGIKCSREFRAIENVGLYIPGGNAVLPSTMLMLGIPAQIAGCKRVVVCSPSKDGKINYPLLFAAKLCGINEFYKIGGAQAIGLMAYGDETIEKVNKIFGPGNQYVTSAKLLVSIDAEGCSIDMPAGPSEVLVIVDENSNASFAAADLLSQAEHGSDSQVVLVSTSDKKVDEVLNEIKIQIEAFTKKRICFQIIRKFICINS